MAGHITASLPQTIEQLLEKIKRRLGGQDVDIEVEFPEIEDAVADGLAYLSSYVPIYTKHIFTAKEHTSNYALPSDCLYIDWVAPEPTYGAADELMWSMNRRVAKNLFLNVEYGNFGNYFQVGTLARYLNYYEQQSRVLGMNFTWFRNGRTIEIQPTPTQSYRFMASYSKWKSIPELDPFENTWLYKYSLAVAKVVVGRKRNKYGSTLPMHGGELTFELDGGDLITEGREEIEKLENQLINDLAAPPRFLTEDNG